MQCTLRTYDSITNKIMCVLYGWQSHKTKCNQQLNTTKSWMKYNQNQDKFKWINAWATDSTEPVYMNKLDWDYDNIKWISSNS